MNATDSYPSMTGNREMAAGVFKQAEQDLVLTGEMKTTGIVIAGGGDVEAMRGMPVEHAKARNLVFHRIDLMGASLGHEDIK